MADQEMTPSNDAGAMSVEADSAPGYPRSEDENDYTYWQWVTAEEYFELEAAEDDGVAADAIAEIQSRIDLHLAKFRAASEQTKFAPGAAE
jgi:hypothetical protein